MNDELDNISDERLAEVLYEEVSSKVDPPRTSDLRVNLSNGVFRVSVGDWPCAYNHNLKRACDMAAIRAMRAHLSSRWPKAVSLSEDRPPIP